MSKAVLVVDDALSLHRLIATYLEPDDMPIHAAYDGEAGLAAAAHLRPGLILLGIDTPRLDGFEVWRRLKADPTTARIPVLFLTSSVVMDIRAKGLNIGSSDFIIKPFKPAEFRARVRAALRSRHELAGVSLVDAPTGLWNRAYFDAHIDYHVSLAKRHFTPLSCILTEIDDGTELEQRYGEGLTSNLIRGVGSLLRGRCRVEDVVCRFDTWKFAILATNANRAGATLITSRLRSAIERESLFGAGCETRIKCGFGVADILSADPDTLVQRAEAALGESRRVALDGGLVAV